MDRSAFVPFSVSLGSNPVLLIIINQGACRLRRGFTWTQPDFLAGSVSAEHRRGLGPEFNEPACWDLRKGFVPSGPPAAAALVSPVSPPHFPGQQTLVRGEPPPLSHWPYLSLKACCYWSTFLCRGRALASEERYDLGREA